MSEENQETKLAEERQPKYDLQKIEVTFEKGVALPGTFAQIVHMAQGLRLAGAFSNYKTLGEYVTCVMKAAEIGRSPSYVYENTWQNRGKTYFYGDHIDSKVLGSGLLESMSSTDIVKDEEFFGVEFEAMRKGGLKAKVRFTMDDARRAGLLDKDNWKCYPKDMCFQRAKNKAYRRLFADALEGVKPIEDSEFESDPREVTSKLASANDMTEKLEAE